MRTLAFVCCVAIWLAGCAARQDEVAPAGEPEAPVTLTWTAETGIQNGRASIAGDAYFPFRTTGGVLLLHGEWTPRSSAAERLEWYLYDTLHDEEVGKWVSRSPFDAQVDVSKGKYALSAGGASDMEFTVLDTVGAAVKGPGLEDLDSG